MKKSVVFMLLFMVVAALAHAQVLIALLVGDKLNSDKFELGINLAGNWQNFTGVEGSLEYKLMKQKGVHIGLRYYLGLTDIYKDNPGAAVKNSVIQINLGIPLGGHKKTPKS